MEKYLCQVSLMFWCSIIAIPGLCLASEATVEDEHKLGTRLEETDKLKAYEMLALQQKGNYVQIRTWSGVYNFAVATRMYSPLPKAMVKMISVEKPKREAAQWFSGTIATGKDAGGGTWLINRGTLTFSVDIPNNKYHAYFDANQAIAIVDVESGDEFRLNASGSSVHTILTAESGMVFDTKDTFPQLRRFQPVDSVPPSGGRILYRKTPQKAVRSTVFFDARNMFAPAGRKQLAWTHCELVVNSLRNAMTDKSLIPDNNLISIYMNHEQPPVYTEVSTSKTTTSKSTNVFDGKARFNLVAASHVSTMGLVEVKNSYRQVGEVVLPEKVERIQSDRSQKRLLPQRIEQFTLATTQLNVPISDAEFSVDGLGLRYGERMMDETEDRLFVYGGKAGFIPSDKFIADPSQLEWRKKIDATKAKSKLNRQVNANAAQPRRLFLIVNGVIIVVIAGLYIRRRFVA